MKKTTSVFLVCAIALFGVKNVFAKQTGDWNSLANYLNQQIAVKERGKSTVYGILRSVNDDGIEIQIAEKKDISAAATKISRSEIQKIWTAKLRYGGRQIGKGGLIGAGAGAAVGTAVFLGTKSSDDDGLAGAAIPLGAVYGAGIGAVIGIFSKKSHKRQKLIYSI